MSREELEERIVDIQAEIDSFEVSDHVSESDYDNYIDELEGDVTICGMSYSASRVLSEIDPIAYRCGFADYCDTLDASEIEAYQELETELDELERELEELGDEE